MRISDWSSDVCSSDLDATGEFPPMMLHMIASGEKSGELDQMLARTARNQENDLAAQVSLLVGLFEPFMLVFMGAVVLVIVLAILMPILSLNQIGRAHRLNSSH